MTSKGLLEKESCCCSASTTEKSSCRDDGKRAHREGIMRCSESTLVQHVHQVDSDKLEAKDAQWTMLISGYVENGCGEKACQHS